MDLRRITNFNWTLQVRHIDGMDEVMKIHSSLAIFYRPVPGGSLGWEITCCSSIVWTISSSPSSIVKSSSSSRQPKRDSNADWEESMRGESSIDWRDRVDFRLKCWIIWGRRNRVRSLLVLSSEFWVAMLLLLTSSNQTIDRWIRTGCSNHSEYGDLVAGKEATSPMTVKLRGISKIITKSIQSYRAGGLTDCVATGLWQGNGEIP